MSTKPFLLDLLNRPELEANQVDTLWLDRLTAKEAHQPRQHADVVLQQAAIEAYDAKQLVEQAQFYASAARGRPRVRQDAALPTDLRYRGQRYRFSISHLGAQRYRVITDGQTSDVRIERLGPFERRITCDWRRYRVFSVVDGPNYYVEVDGIPHRIIYEEAGIIRAPAPAVVVSIAVAPGDHINGGDQLAVVEAMKMEMAITAPFSGRVAWLFVVSNVQVDVGAPLIQLEPLTLDDQPTDLQRVLFGNSGHTGVLHEDVPQLRCRRALEALRCQLLRYDIDPTEATWLLNEQKAVYRLIEADDQELLRDEILSIFADICSLFRRELDPAEAAAQDEQVHSAEQDLLTYLRSRDTHVERLPVVFLENLQRALAHYGIRGQIPSPRLDESLLLMYKSHLRVNQQLAAIIAILERRFAQAGRLASLATEDKRAMLNRLLLATQGRYPAVNDLAREMRFRCFDEPWFEQARNKVYQEMQAHLASLTSHPTAADRVELISLLVTYPQPLQNFLTSRFPQSDEQMRKTMLEVLTRRFYRIRRLEDFECTTVAGQTFAKAAYDYEGARIVAVTTFARYEELDAATTAMARFVTRFPDVHGVVVVANLSGFDGSPESMRNSELEFGAEIGRAVTNFRGPLVFCIISRLHGGSFVVFSRTLNENIEIAAVEGSYASVIGGIPAAAVVFARDVDTRTKNDPRVKALQEQLAKVDSTQKTALHAQLHAAMEQVRSEKVGEVAGEFDHIHTIQRAQRVGSVDYVIPAAMLRPYIVEALERGIARELQRWNIDS